MNSSLPGNPFADGIFQNQKRSTGHPAQWLTALAIAHEIRSLTGAVNRLAERLDPQHQHLCTLGNPRCLTCGALTELDDEAEDGYDDDRTL